MKPATAKLGRLGKYSLIASLGQGGMAKVYLGLVAGPAGFNKLLVIKALRDDVLSGSEEFVAMFLDEARLAARLSHPNIVQTYEVGEHGGRYYIAMEYLEGQTLRGIQRRFSPQGLPLAEELRVLAQTAHGLHYAHGLKGFNGEPLSVVHRDVSPQNVFLNYDGQIKLLDFGIAKTKDAQHLTKSGVIKGKIDYIAPEQIRGAAVDARADIFALGAMLWEALAGRSFAGGAQVAEVTKIHTRVTGAEPKLRDVAPDVPDTLAEICERAIALEVCDRYTTAAEFAEDLERYLYTTGLKPSARSLADLISPMFAVERERMRLLIDGQIQCVARDADGELSDETVSLPRIQTSYTPTTSGTRTDVSPTEAGQLEAGTREKPSTGTSIKPPYRFGVPDAVVVGMLATGAAVATLIVLQSDEPAAKAGSAMQVNPAGELIVVDPSPPQLTFPRMESVHVKIDVWPADAQVSLDGAILPHVPFDAEVTKDAALHHLYVTAKGYTAIKQAVQFDQDREIKIVLERDKGPEASASLPQKKKKGVVHSGTSIRGQSADAASEADLTETPIPSLGRPSIDIDDPYRQP